MNKIPWWRTSFGEAELKKLRESILNEHISLGPVTEQFEAQIAEALNVPYTVAVPSGSVALLMAMMAGNIGPGDEVIVPNRTWISTAHAPLILGAKVVLVDVQEDLPKMDISQIRQKITSRTKAIIPTHLDGRGVSMREIQDIAKEYGLFVAEDACQAMFSKNAAGFLGTQSDVGCFSLGVTKLVSTGQGGVIVTRRKDIYEKLKLIRNNGLVDHFDPVYNIVGCNFKFTDILASIGIVQLSQSRERIANVCRIYSKYLEAIESLSYLKVIPVNVSEGEVPLYVEVLCKERKRLMSFLESQGIQTRPFLPNLDSAPYLKSVDKFPNSEIFNKHGMFLPCGPAQPIENIDRVIESLRSFGSHQ